MIVNRPMLQSPLSKNRLEPYNYKQCQGLSQLESDGNYVRIAPNYTFLSGEPVTADHSDAHGGTTTPTHKMATHRQLWCSALAPGNQVWVHRLRRNPNISLEAESLLLERQGCYASEVHPESFLKEKQVDGLWDQFSPRQWTDKNVCTHTIQRHTPQRSPTVKQALTYASVTMLSRAATCLHVLKILRSFILVQDAWLEKGRGKASCNARGSVTTILHSHQQSFMLAPLKLFSFHNETRRSLTL